MPVVALLCVLLLGLLAAVQVAHFHSNQSVSDHCPLCASAHSAAPLAVAALGAILLVQVGRSTPVLERHAIARCRSSKLFTRPPPTGL
jgi:hypothetical protein